VGGVWAVVPLLGHLAACDQYRDDGTNIFGCFPIQHSQNRDGRAIQLKLDQLIQVTTNARNRLIDLENCTDEEMEALQDEFAKVRAERSQRD
jgi:low affinity Fe/Cu permease